MNATKNRTDRFQALSERSTERTMDEIMSMDNDLIRNFLVSVGMHWAAKTTLRSNVTQSSFRLTMGMANAIKRALPFHTTHADLHITLSAMYVVDDDVRARVDRILADKGAGLSEDLVSRKIRTALEELGMVWHSRTPLRDSVTQSSFRITLDMATTLKREIPVGTTLAETHIVLTAMYLVQPDFRKRIDSVLNARYDQR